jgi:hypothetical protein
MVSIQRQRLIKKDITTVVQAEGTIVAVEKQSQENMRCCRKTLKGQMVDKGCEVQEGVLMTLRCKLW